MTNKKRNFTSFHEQKGVVNKWRDFLTEAREEETVNEITMSDVGMTPDPRGDGSTFTHDMYKLKQTPEFLAKAAGHYAKKGMEKFKKSRPGNVTSQLIDAFKRGVKSGKLKGSEYLENEGDWEKNLEKIHDLDEKEVERANRYLKNALKGAPAQEAMDAVEQLTHSAIGVVGSTVAKLAPGAPEHMMSPTGEMFEGHEEGCPGCEKCLGEGFVTSSVGHRDENLPWSEASVSKEIERAKQLDTDDEYDDYDEDNPPAHEVVADKILSHVYKVIANSLDLPSTYVEPRGLMTNVELETEKEFLDIALAMAQRGIEVGKDEIEKEKLSREEEATDDLMEGAPIREGDAEVEAILDVEDILRKIYDKLDLLDDVDASIDYLGSALTGETPQLAQVKQAAVGRLARPSTSPKKSPESK